jgi:hypothetical protein
VLVDPGPWDGWHSRQIDKPGSAAHIVRPSPLFAPWYFRTCPLSLRFHSGISSTVRDLRSDPPSAFPPFGWLMESFSSAAIKDRCAIAPRFNGDWISLLCHQSFCRRMIRISSHQSANAKQSPARSGWPLRIAASIPAISRRQRSIHGAFSLSRPTSANGLPSAPSTAALPV